MDIRHHKLAWRWTDRNYAQLPDDVLCQLLPIDEAEAMEHHKGALSYLGREALSPRFRSLVMNTEHLSAEEGSHWLMQQWPSLGTEVVLSWDPTVALKTTWAIFVKYWQEFCYPASDDLVVFPLTGSWVLLYHHEEAFHFGLPTIDA